ncbi:MAG: sporulation protein YunB, partial [Clostridia bacterium]|nr:sporulation protein YunB [Clostridia bacterium]
GSATGLTVLSGLGPVIDVSVSYSSSTESDFENEFTAVGMNQTQHRVMLSVTSNILMALAGGRVANTVTTTFCVAQTVIVGTVPDIVFN